MKPDDVLTDFLKAAGWADARVVSLPADFSTRKFYRVEGASGKAILMQAAPEQKTREFVALAGILRSCGLSAPRIYADEAERGLVLMEDFGDANFGRMLDAGHAALPLYRRAAEVLATLHGACDISSLGGFQRYTPEAFVEQLSWFTDYYFPFARKREASEDERREFQDVWRAALGLTESVPHTLILRDFMPDNLMDLPKRQGVQSVGLLDFQDGGLGPMAYDLATLCECVRRDVPPSLLDDMIAHYHAQNPVMPLEDLRQACRIFAAQRHMRVLGNVTRLAKKQGREDKLVYIPRLRRYLAEILQDDALQSVRQWFDRHFGDDA